MSARDYARDLEDYVDVPERISLFRERYPDGSLQAEVIRWPEDGFAGIAVRAFAYRSPTDERPGIGHAFEPVPGTTPYTSNSELQNAETSAWGRAIVAALAADTKRGIASREEVRNRASASDGSGTADGEGPSGKPTDAGDTSASGQASSADAAAPGEELSPESAGHASSPGRRSRKWARDREHCDHRKPGTAEWAPRVQHQGQPVCGLCGIPAVQYIEAA